MQAIKIFGEYLFEFTSEQHWINKAKGWFERLQLQAGEKTVCVDARGFVLNTGADFKAAEENSLYPAKVYKLARVMENINPDIVDQQNFDRFINQELFNYLSREFGATATADEMGQIIDIVRRWDLKDRGTPAGQPGAVMLSEGQQYLAGVIKGIIDFMENDEPVPDYGKDSTNEDALVHIRQICKEALENMTVETDAADGLALIRKERQEQVEKHGRTIAYDLTYNSTGQLGQGAVFCITERYPDFPKGWPEQFGLKICDKPYLDRLIIAGALVAAEIDRLLHIQNGMYKNSAWNRRIIEHGGDFVNPSEL
jgi:hypothetical protein